MDIKEFGQCCVQLRSLMTFKTTRQKCLCCGIEDPITDQVNIVMKHYFGDKANIGSLNLLEEKAEEMFTLTKEQASELIDALIFT